MTSRFPKFALVVAGLFFVSCGSGFDKTNGFDSTSTTTDTDGGTPGAFGESTSAVIIVNPVINQGSSTSVQPGVRRGGISVAVAGVTSDTTDGSGLAVLTELTTGDLSLDFDTGSASLTVVQEKENYDLVVAYTPSGVQHIVEPIRYPVGGSVAVLAPGSNLADALKEDASIVILQEGKYPGNLEIAAQGVLIFGAWSPTKGPLSVIEGDVDVRGGNGRMRGVEVTGKIISHANGFSAAFNRFGGADITGNGVTLIRNEFPPNGQVTVPSSNAVLVDNKNIP